MVFEEESGGTEVGKVEERALFDGKVGLGENLAENFASRVAKGFIRLGVVDGGELTED